MNYIINILNELNFKKNDFNFYYKECDDFFRVDDYSESEFENYFNCEKTKQATLDYEQLMRTNNEAKINSAQIILIKVEEFRDFFKSTKNQIMKVEEDPYYFRKYVLAYTSNSINDLYNLSLSELKEYILKDEEYDAFEKDMYCNSTYFLAMQSFIKLPFLTIPTKNEEYSSLQYLIDQEIEKKNIVNSEKKALEISNYISSSDFDKESVLSELLNLDLESDFMVLLKGVYRNND